jgi:hypothetical protein
MVARKLLILLRVILAQTGFSSTGTTAGVCDASGLAVRISNANQRHMQPSVLSCPFYGVPPNRRKFRQAKSWPRCAPHGQTFRISGQKRKARTPPRAAGRVPSHRIAPRQPSKTGKFPLARGLAGRNPAWRNFRRLGLTTPNLRTCSLNIAFAARLLISCCATWWRPG